MCCWTRIIAPNSFLVKGFLEIYENSFIFFIYLHIIYKNYPSCLYLSIVFYNPRPVNIQGTLMRLLFLFSTLFLLSACMDTAEVPTSTAEEKSITQIKSNKTEAQEAQDEYKKLQEQRGKE